MGIDKLEFGCILVLAHIDLVLEVSVSPFRAKKFIIEWLGVVLVFLLAIKIFLEEWRALFH
jgi:hypothetical protein